MTQKSYSFKYDDHTDSLMIYLGTAPRFYSEEIEPGIYESAKNAPYFSEGMNWHIFYN